MYFLSPRSHFSLVFMGMWSIGRNFCQKHKCKLCQPRKMQEGEGAMRQGWLWEIKSRVNANCPDRRIFVNHLQHWVGKEDALDVQIIYKTVGIEVVFCLSLKHHLTLESQFFIISCCVLHCMSVHYLGPQEYL